MIAWIALLQLTIATGPATAPEALPLHVAEAEGFFAREGIRVTLQSQRADVAAAEALGAGRAALAATSLDAALRLGHDAGAPPRLLFGLTAAPAVALLVPAGGAAVREPAELAGKTVGIPAPGTPEHLALLSVLARARVPVGRTTIASFGERGLANALATGAVAAGVLGDPHATRLVEDGQAAVLVDLRRPADRRQWLGGETVHAALFVRARDARDGADLVGVARALVAAVERVRTASPGALAAALPAAVTGPPDAFAARLEGARGLYLDRGRVSAEALERSIELVRERFPIPEKVKLPKLDRLLWLAPLDAALGRPAR